MQRAADERSEPHTSDRMGYVHVVHVDLSVIDATPSNCRRTKRGLEKSRLGEFSRKCGICNFVVDVSEMVKVFNSSYIILILTNSSTIDIWISQQIFHDF